MKQFFIKLLEIFSKKENKVINNSVKTHPHSIDEKGISEVFTITEMEPEKVNETFNKKEIPNMYNFGKRSRERLDTCHPDMIAIMEQVIKVYDFSVLEGLRTAEKQAEYFETGRSKLDGVHKKSKHQDDGSGKSRAIDIMPYKKGSNAFSGQSKDKARFYYLGGLVKMAAAQLLAEGKISHTIRWGADWNSNDLFDDQNFDDLPHFELKSI